MKNSILRYAVVDPSGVVLHEYNTHKQAYEVARTQTCAVFLRRYVLDRNSDLQWTPNGHSWTSPRDQDYR